MKYFLIAFLSVLSIQLFAAYQYNTKGNQTWFTFDSNTSITLDVTRSGKDKDHTNFIDDGNGIQDYGWYNLNTNEYGSLKDNTITFTENDKIAFWVKDNQNNTFISTKGQDASGFIWGKSDTKDDIFKIYGGNKGSNGTHEYYVFSVKTVNPNNGNTPSGQPLPGIIATLIIGGGGILYIKNRKKLLEK